MVDRDGTDGAAGHMRRCAVIVGRTPELDRIHHVLTHEEEPAVVAVSGEAGLGKSRLLEEALSTLDGEFVVRSGACHLADQVLPFGLFLDLASRQPPDDRALLADVLDDAGDDHDPSAEGSDLRRRRKFDAMVNALVNGERRSIIVIEDIHWADEVSLQAVGHLVRRIAGTRHRLVVTYRPREQSPELSALLAEASRLRATEPVELRTLATDEIAAMVEAMTGAAPTADDRERLAELSDGNPFHVEELIRSTGGNLASIEAAVPQTVQHSVVSRLAALDPETRRAASRAAVIGRDVPVDQLRELMEWDEAETLRHATSLVDAGLLRDVDGNRLRFVHELARRAVESQLLALERTAVHRSIAEFMQQRLVPHTPDGERMRADLARHAYASQDWQTAIDHGTAAARTALERWSARAAAVHLDRVIDAGARSGLQLDADVYVLRARALRHRGQVDGARDDLVTAIGIADAADDRASAWEGRYELAMLDTQHSHERAVASLDEALDAARRWGDRVAIARTLNRQGNLAANRLEFDAALDLLGEAKQMATDEGDLRVMAEAGVLSMVTNSLRGDLVEARRHGTEAVAHLRRVDAPVDLVNALFSLSMTGGEHFGDLSPSSAPLAVCASEAEEALELATRLGWTSGRALSARALAGVRSAQGRAAEAVTLLDESIRLAESVGHLTHILRGNAVMGEVRLDIGDSIGARRHLERALEVAGQVGAAAASLPSEIRMVEVDVFEGRLDDAQRRLTDILDRLPGSARATAGAYGELLLARGDAASTLELVDDALDSLPGARPDPPPVRLGLLRGRALAGLGRLDDAAEVLLAADLEARRIGFHQMLRNIVAARAQVAARAGDRDQAARLCDEAWRFVSTASDGLDPELASLLRADMERRTSSLPRRSGAAAESVDVLTKREREVAMVLSRGLTNQQIADELFISVRTAETHVKRILSKLGFGSRGQVAHWVRENGPTDA